ncbi:MAG: hydrolase, partial [Ignavibacteriales bacterium]|nr:hydrolase [Ignavibacteriales bacterium]
MKNLFLLFLFISSPILAQNDEKKLILKFIDSDISIDGNVDPVWNTADSTGNFFQLTPYFAKEPSNKTVAKILANENSLYCLIICYDDRTNIISNTGTLDNFDGDIVSIMIDTFDDKITGYKFAVSASGVRSDCRLLDDARNRDYSWDGIWFADSKI